MTSSLLIMVDSATQATMTMLVAAENPPRIREHNVSQS